MLKQAFTKYDYCILEMEYILMGLLTKFEFENPSLKQKLTLVFPELQIVC